MFDALHTALAPAATGPLTVDLTTVGRRSGAPRRIEIWVVLVAGRIVVTGTPGRRDWFANVAADPSVVLHLKHVGLDVRCTAEVVTDEAVRRAVFEHDAARWYVQNSTVEELVAAAPMIELTPDPHGGDGA